MKTEKFIQTALLAQIPILFFLVSWWSFAFHVDDKFIPYISLGGLIIGIFVAFLFKRKMTSIYRLPLIVIILSYLFYNICIFGFFMGVPIFNLILSPIAGYYMAGWGRGSKKILKLTKIFTSITIALIAAGSGALALTDPFTEENLEGMLSVKLDRLGLQLVVFCGAIVMLALNYILVNYFFGAKTRHMLGWTPACSKAKEKKAFPQEHIGR